MLPILVPIIGLMLECYHALRGDYATIINGCIDQDDFCAVHSTELQQCLAVFLFMDRLYVPSQQLAARDAPPAHSVLFFGGVERLHAAFVSLDCSSVLILCDVLQTKLLQWF
jgi:hypothetical protein